MKKKWLILLIFSMYAIQIALFVLGYFSGRGDVETVAIRISRAFCYAFMISSTVLVIINFVSATKTYSRLSKPLPLGQNYEQNSFQQSYQQNYPQNNYQNHPQNNYQNQQQNHPQNNGGERTVFCKVMIFKLILIPFYVINFAIWVCVAALALMPWFLFIVVFLVILGSIFAYLTMLATSSYNIAKLASMRKQKKLSLIECLLHIALQLFFLADVIDSVVLKLRFDGKE